MKALLDKLAERVISNPKSTAVGALLGVIAITEAVQKAGHNSTAVIVGVATALLGLLAKD